MNKKIFTISIVSFVIDQITKIIIDMSLDIDQVKYIIKNFFAFTKVGNTGAAFSVLEGNILLLILISFIAIILLLFIYKDFKINKRNNFAFGLLYGGIVGNLSDRLFLGYVRDFIKVDIFSYEYPIFNIADTAIVIGAILLIYSMFNGDDKNEVSSRKFRRTSKTR